EAPLRHANGAHWGRFVRTIIEVETDEGLVGLGEMGGGGESAENAIRALKSYLLGTIRCNSSSFTGKSVIPLRPSTTIACSCTPPLNLLVSISWEKSLAFGLVTCWEALYGKKFPSPAIFFTAIAIRRPASAAKRLPARSSPRQR